MATTPVSSCSFERMPELLYRVRFNIPPSIHANQLPWYGWGVILGPLFPSSWLLFHSLRRWWLRRLFTLHIHSLIMIKGNHQNHRSRTEIQTGRSRTNGPVQPTRQCCRFVCGSICSSVSVHSGRRIEAVSRWNDNHFAWITAEDYVYFIRVLCPGQGAL